MDLEELTELHKEYNEFDNKLFLVGNYYEEPHLSVDKVIGYNSDSNKWIAQDLSGIKYEVIYAFKIPEKIPLRIAVDILNYHKQFESEGPTHKTIRTIYNWKFYLGNIFGYAIDDSGDNIACFLTEDDDFWSIRDMEINTYWFKDIIDVLTMK